jgi:predicted transcriptional regulator
MKRDRKKIMLGILQILEKESCRKTKIVYGLMINFKFAQELLEDLVARGYVDYLPITRYYGITDMGRHAMRILEAAELEWQ